MSEEFLLRLWIVRHGQTKWNETGKCLGRTNLPLSRNGKKAVKEIAKSIDLSQCDAVLSSPSRRTVETAKIITKNSLVPTNYCEGLREIDFGNWEGMTWEHIIANRSQEWALWKKDPYLSNPYGGESLFDVEYRIKTLYLSLLQEFSHKTILLVSHSGIMNVFLCYLFQLPLGVEWTYPLRPASFSEVLIHPMGPIINILNYTPFGSVENVLFEKRHQEFPLLVNI